MSLFPKKYILQFLCNISYLLNLPQRIGPFGKDKFMVLMYHGTIKSYSAKSIRNISTYNILEKKFEEQMAYLANHCNAISVSDAIAEKKHL